MRERQAPVALTGGRIALSHEVVDGAALLIEGDHVAAVTTEAELGDVERIDVGGRLIAPGLVDIHMHGARLSAFAGADEVSFTTVCEAAARAGVTSLLATFSTAPVRISSTGCG